VHFELFRFFLIFQYSVVQILVCYLSPLYVSMFYAVWTSCVMKFQLYQFTDFTGHDLLAQEDWLGPKGRRPPGAAGYIRQMNRVNSRSGSATMTPL